MPIVREPYANELEYAGATKTHTKAEEWMIRLEEMTSRICREGVRVDRFTDMLTGAVPQSVDASQDGPEPPDLMGAMEVKLNKLNAALSQLQGSVDRLRESNLLPLDMEQNDF